MRITKLKELIVHEQDDRGPRNDINDCLFDAVLDGMEQLEELIFQVTPLTHAHHPHMTEPVMTAFQIAGAVVVWAIRVIVLLPEIKEEIKLKPIRKAVGHKRRKIKL